MVVAAPPPATQFFNFAQTFYVDPSAVGGGSTVGISDVNLFFMYRPAPTDNLSGTPQPGVAIFLTDTLNGFPIINQDTYSRMTRAEYMAIDATSDASRPTNFRFATPIQVATGKTYAVLVSYDQNEQFAVWTNRKGFPLVGSGLNSPGPSSQYNGSYFEYVSSSATTATEPQYNPITGQVEWIVEPVIQDGESSGTGDGFSWKSLPNVDLMFEVHGARYYQNTVPVFALDGIFDPTFTGSASMLASYDPTTNTVTMDYPASRMEIFTFNRAASTKQLFVGGQRVFQNTVYYPGGNSYATVSVNMSNVITANTQTSNGQAFSWANVYGTYTGDKFVVLFNGDGTINVRLVTSILSNTQIAVDEPTSFVNSAAKIMISPIATIDSWNTSVNWGPNGNLLYYVFAKDSNANATVRFTSCSVDFQTSAVANGGTGYSNTDILYITGYEHVVDKVPEVKTEGVGNYPAWASISTNSTGGITGVQMGNVGSGFTNTANIKTLFLTAPNTNPTANTSAGSGANIVVGIGSTICTELTNNVLRQCNVVNLDIEYCNPYFSLGSPAEVEHSLFLKSLYTVTEDPTVSSGFAYSIVANVALTRQPIVMNTINRFNNINNPIPCFVSYSNEFIMLHPDGSLNTQVDPLTPWSNNYVIEVVTKSFNDYAALNVNNTPFVEFCKYLVNDDYTAENTNYGNAMAKHITSVVNFSANNGLVRLAEDIRVYLTAYRPANTDIEVYARIQNSSDPEAFDDEDWTRLNLIDGNFIFSSPSLITDYIELTYGFPQTPNTDLNLVGSVTVGNNTSNVIGVGTTFTTQLVTGDLIKIYDPLFPNTENHAVVMVTNVNSDTSITTDADFVSNFMFGIGGPELADTSGLAVSRIRNFKNQAFNNVQGENVARYYTMTSHKFDGFDSLQVKVVMLTQDLHQIPRINNIRGIGLSA